MTYAATTSVPSDRSRGEIERTLMRYGATGFFYTNEPKHCFIGFKACERIVRFRLPMPSREDFKFVRDRKGNNTFRQHPTARQESMYEQAVRTRWRCLALAVKAKLEAVESGIETFESVFLANILLADNRTVADHVLPRIAENYKTGKVVPLLEAAP